MNILGLLDTPTSGGYILNGIDVSRMEEDTLSGIRNKEIGFVFQSFNLLSRATTLENVILPAIYAGLKPKEREIKAKNILKKLGLEGKESNKPNQLSGGQQQRVALARSLIKRPKVLLLDEPSRISKPGCIEKIVSVAKMRAADFSIEKTLEKLSQVFRDSGK